MAQPGAESNSPFAKDEFAAGQRIGEMQRGFIEHAVSKPFLEGDFSSAIHDQGREKGKA